MPVLAPAEGTVEALYGDAHDMPVGILGGTPPTGNYIILKVADQEYLLLCHLKPDSISVEVGEKVSGGREIAQVGNTGNTSEPHLHLHLQSTPIFAFGEGVPMFFHNCEHNGLAIEKGVPEGGIKDGRFVGHVIEHAE